MAIPLGKVLAAELGTSPKVVISIPVLLVGGTEVQTLSLVKVLRAAGFGVSVCCYYEYHERMVSEMEMAGADVALLGLSRESGFFRLLIELVRYFKRTAPNVAHIQYIAPGLVPIVAARLAGIRTVFATVHQTGGRFGKKAKLFFAVSARLCTAFFCVSKTVEETWFGDSALYTSSGARRGRRHFTIYNGVAENGEGHESSLEQSAKLKADLGLTGKRVIGVVARLRAEKGHILLLRALPLVLKAIPDACLLVVGDGPDREALMKQSCILGVAPQVVWAGECSPAAVKALYDMMDVVAVPSQFEGFGLSAAEAMAAGCPVVGTRVGGLAEVVEDGVTGHLTSPDDGEAFAAALIKVLNDPLAAKAMGERGRSRVAANFSSERFARTVVAAYRCFIKDEQFPSVAGDSPRLS